MAKKKHEILEDTVAPKNRTRLVGFGGCTAYVTEIDETTRVGRHIIATVERQEKEREERQKSDKK